MWVERQYGRKCLSYEYLVQDNCYSLGFIELVCSSGLRLGRRGRYTWMWTNIGRSEGVDGNEHHDPGCSALKPGHSVAAVVVAGLICSGYGSMLRARITRS